MCIRDRPYPDCVYEEAVDYLIELAEATEDYSMERMLVSYKRKPTSIKSRVIARMLCGKKHAELVDAIIRPASYSQYLKDKK